MWRSLKHGWLFLNPLDSVVQVRSLVAFHVAEHNARLDAGRGAAHAARLDTHRA